MRSFYLIYFNYLGGIKILFNLKKKVIIIV